MTDLQAVPSNLLTFIRYKCKLSSKYPCTVVQLLAHDVGKVGDDVYRHGINCANEEPMQLDVDIEDRIEDFDNLLYNLVPRAFFQFPQDTEEGPGIEVAYFSYWILYLSNAFDAKGLHNVHPLRNQI